MAQGVLPFKYEEEKKETGMTGLAGLPVYLDLAYVISFFIIFSVASVLLI